MVYVWNDIVQGQLLFQALVQKQRQMSRWMYFLKAHCNSCIHTALTFNSLVDNKVADVYKYEGFLKT